MRSVSKRETFSLHAPAPFPLLRPFPMKNFSHIPEFFILNQFKTLINVQILFASHFAKRPSVGFRERQCLQAMPLPAIEFKLEIITKIVSKSLTVQKRNAKSVLEFSMHEHRLILVHLNN